MTVSGSVHDASPRWSLLLERLTSVWRAVGLTIMWFLTCLPIVTAGAATLALFAVVREDVLHRERPVVRSYLAHLRAGIGTGTWLLLTTLTPFLTVCWLWRQGDGLLMSWAWGLALLGAAASLPLVVHGFSLAAHTTQPSWRALYRASLLLTLARPGAALLGLGVIGVCVVAVILWPGSLLLLAYPAARALFVSFRSAFEVATTGRSQAHGTT